MFYYVLNLVLTNVVQALFNSLSGRTIKGMFSDGLNKTMVEISRNKELTAKVLISRALRSST